MLKRFCRWVIFGSGIYDVVLGIILISTATAASSSNWLMNQTIGAFLIFAGVLLVWSSQAIESRCTVIFWQGLVRLWAAGATLIAWERGWLDPDAAQGALPAAGIDVVFALFYGAALFAIWRLPVSTMAFGRSVPE